MHWRRERAGCQELSPPRDNRRGGSGRRLLLALFLAEWRQAWLLKIDHIPVGTAIPR
jgi:hypothetical protein